MAKQKNKPKDDIDPRLRKADQDVKELLQEPLPLDGHETPFEEELGRMKRSGKGYAKGKKL